jgi:hypothetical protein
MDQQDFLLWHLERAIAVLASVLFGKSSPVQGDISVVDAKQGEQQLDKQAQESLGLSWETIEATSPDRLKERLYQGGGSWCSRFLAVGMLFELSAYLASSFGQAEQAVARATKSLFFLKATLKFVNSEERNRVLKRCEHLQNLLPIRGRSDHQI